MMTMRKVNDHDFAMVTLVTGIITGTAQQVLKWNHLASASPCEPLSGDFYLVLMNITMKVAG